MYINSEIKTRAEAMVTRNWTSWTGDIPLLKRNFADEPDTAQKKAASITYTYPRREIPDDCEAIIAELGSGWTSGGAAGQGAGLLCLSVVFSEVTLLIFPAASALARLISGGFLGRAPRSVFGLKKISYIPK